MAFSKSSGCCCCGWRWPLLCVGPAISREQHPDRVRERMKEQNTKENERKN
jgi:hypothetical protein